MANELFLLFEEYDYTVSFERQGLGLRRYGVDEREKVAKIGTIPISGNRHEIPSSQSARC